MADEHCLHEGRWTAVLGDIVDLKKRDLGLWVRWGLPILATLLVTAVGFLDRQITAVDVRADAHEQSSAADRRMLATKSIELESVQKTQFAQILGELQYLRQKLDRMERR